MGKNDNTDKARDPQELPRWNSGPKVDYYERDKAELWKQPETAKDNENNNQTSSAKDSDDLLDDEWNERIAGWNKRDAYKSLAENVLKAKTLERKESQDQQTLQEAETALSALNKYMTENNLPEDDNGFRAALEKTNMYKDFMTQTKGKIKALPHKWGRGGTFEWCGC